MLGRSISVFVTSFGLALFGLWLFTVFADMELGVFAFILAAAIPLWLMHIIFEYERNR